ncbi:MULTISPECIES: YbdK family carboxylate-amine ligase [unclassified Microbacterium]|uniref:carboxylate-amine ligase n=1 Tax=unclassified Microbacterium TaxID=2609290 RepID=UPI000EA9D444|nr:MULTISPECIES: YbdK family carboxylate-amine ligase [unclassified Microbacterium]MBT2483466.1 YbdK family carboxylate-amine ligase [Microbacterium sp. ISL-108]RKN66488.1 YbdK family carboxylate-amine ligase [Microbacterium sp. CGR2]
MTRFGIEEEFILLDRDALVPLSMTPATRKSLLGIEPAGRVTTEYLACQFESATDPLHTRAGAEEQLRALRSEVGRLARAQGVIAAATGSPFTTTRAPMISPSAHYDDVSHRLAHLTREHEVNGLHVHVEVLDPEDRIWALNRLRGWLPALLALTVNSPFANGVDAGFASWRTMLIRRLPSSWCPPRFQDYDAYDAYLRQLLSVGTIGEATSLSAAIRVSERYPTVEVRVFDAQLEPADSVLAALLCRALVLSDDSSLTSDHIDGIDASLWSAARSGMDARIIDPTTGEVADAWQVVERMLTASAPALQEFGDEEFVAAGIERLRAHGTGAVRQRRAFEADGTLGLARLFEAGTATANEAAPG